MDNIKGVSRGGIVMAIIAFAAGCVVAEPREGYYDRDHHRYYREHTWHECGERDEVCR
jgi:hypothetical protein